MLLRRTLILLISSVTYAGRHRLRLRLVHDVLQELGHGRPPVCDDIRPAAQSSVRWPKLLQVVYLRATQTFRMCLVLRHRTHKGARTTTKADDPVSWSWCGKLSRETPGHSIIRTIRGVDSTPWNASTRQTSRLISSTLRKPSTPRSVMSGR